ncbi:hypothetical protein GQ43DRAFT_89955 [Delitschia confertaspora ATCC 74209]|uniref:Uncharacterized protein n=1 Tax=Delitschia confertaspora ATCC 74209 TaxID=1513339 RepID=A0A9P4JIL3_9PLEO|nr:hypothetical protein GQ43DRAFT_89955 [Delitschia confertaspora ATCC 74209]
MAGSCSSHQLPIIFTLPTFLFSLSHSSLANSVAKLLISTRLSLILLTSPSAAPILFHLPSYSPWSSSALTSASSSKKYMVRLSSLLGLNMRRCISEVVSKVL